MFCAYLDTAYKMSNQLVYAERAALTSRVGTVSQQAFIETTPKYSTQDRLRDVPFPWLAGAGCEWLPNLLTNLVEIGLPLLGRKPLYRHQQEALQAAWSAEGTPRHLIVATGTGSG